MYKLILVLLTSMLIGCNDVGKIRVVERLQEVCDKSTTDIRANFILSCIDNANPHSDEEPEDWLYLCRRIAERTYCPKQVVIVTERCTWGNFGCNRWETVSEKIKLTYNEIESGIH